MPSPLRGSLLRLAIALLGVLVLGSVAAAETVGQRASSVPSDPRPIVASRPAAVGNPVSGPAVTTTTTPPTTTTVPPTTTTAPSSTAPSTTTATAPPAAATLSTAATLPVFDPDDREPGWEQRRGEAALARVDFDPERIEYEVRYLPARSGHYGMTYPQEHRIDVWVRPDQSLELLTHVTAHELGHAVDLVWNDDARRDEYLEARGLGSREWFTCDGCTDFSTPAGDFAEVFARWAVGATDFRSTLAPAPTPEQYEHLVRFFEPPA